MNNKVIIKGNKYGITIVLDPDIEFPGLLEELRNRLNSAESFFDSSRQIAASFEGRNLSNDELDEILTVLENESKLNIQYIIDENSPSEESFRKLAKSFTDNYEKTSVVSSNADNARNLEEANPVASHETIKAPSTGLFYKGTLRSGQTLEAEDSIVIIGDVNPGASVIAGGNIVIIGSLTGSVTAGTKGNRSAFVMALYMNPIQIQISDIIARSSDKKVTDRKNSEKFGFEHKFADKKISKTQKQDAMIATVIDNHIYIDSISKTSIQDIVI